MNLNIIHYLIGVKAKKVLTGSPILIVRMDFFIENIAKTLTVYLKRNYG